MKIKLEERNSKSRGQFRRFARQVCREVFDVPENNKVVFSYENRNSMTLQTGQISFSLADLDMREPETHFDTEFFSQVTFLFVHPDFQMQGYGRLLLQEGLKIMKDHCVSRPVRLQSAWDAVGFFEKCGFKVMSEPLECCHSGTRLFRTLVNMQMELG